MRDSARRAMAAALAGLVCVAAGTVPALGAPPAARSPQVNIWRVTTLDAGGHLAHVFGPGSRIQLRIQWIVRGAPSGARQTTTWTVSYGGKEILRVTKTSTARNGNWSRSTTVTVTRTPNGGTHVFWGRVSVGGVTSARSVAFTVRR
jgi:hypothetical protein